MERDTGYFRLVFGAALATAVAIVLQILTVQSDQFTTHLNSALWFAIAAVIPLTAALASRDKDIERHGIIYILLGIAGGILLIFSFTFLIWSFGPQFYSAAWTGLSIVAVAVVWRLLRWLRD